MGVITTSSFAKALWPGVNAWYGKAYNDYSTEWDQLFEKNTSKKAYEEDAYLLYLFAGLCILYGGFRVYRGIQKNYFKED